MLIDAYLAEENTLSGNRKVFLRSDTDHTWLKNGFTLMAIHRPAAAGTGSGTVISVDPASGITLEELWWELEAMEEEAWRGRRPSDDPRQGIIGYPEGGPNEPWYDGGRSDRSRYTLLAEPKRLPDGSLGSRLGWDDVRQAVWRMYNPGRKLLVQEPDGGDLVSLENCRPYRDDGDKRLTVAHWSQSPRNEIALSLSPTLIRYFAALAARRRNETVTVESLPDPKNTTILPSPVDWLLYTARAYFSSTTGGPISYECRN